MKNKYFLRDLQELDESLIYVKIKARSFIFQATPTVHTNLSRRRSFSKTLIKPVQSENVSFAFECGRKTLWKRSIFANDDVVIIYARDISTFANVS